MRKLMCLVLTISGLAMGCGSDGDGDKKDTVKDAGGGDINIPDTGAVGGDDPYPDCDRADIPATFPLYTGAKPFTQANLMACQTLCMGMDVETCFVEANCPGVEAFFACINNDIPACAVKKDGGECRTEYEDVECCADANKCAPTDQACFTAKCKQIGDDFNTCLQADMGCFTMGAMGCLAPPTTMAPSLGGKSAALTSEALRNAVRAGLKGSIVRH